MNESAKSEATPSDPEKPVQVNDDVVFPPFPDPTDGDFEEDISEEERNFYKEKFPDLNTIRTAKLHCTACDRHLGCSARNESRMRSHPMLRTLMCHTCHTFYNSGEFEKGDDGSELYCRWCGQGGQVYCCSDCPHVFCAKCIKRNLGMPKIKEIENADDWKCFKCNNKCLWDLRAVCWALLRYCDLKNKITYKTQDTDLKEKYQKHLAKDSSECCKSKTSKKKAEKKKDVEVLPKKSSSVSAAAAFTKLPPTIQVKKFASINPDESPKQERKAPKRPSSPKNKPLFFKNPIAVAPSPQHLTGPVLSPNIISVNKKMRFQMPNQTMVNPVNFQKSSLKTFARIRPKQPPILLNNQFNDFSGAMFNNMVVNDNINLSLESLTQGLDMAAVVNMASNVQDDDVVCTPDFPMEPLCEVTEDNDDDVQCITPGPIAVPKYPTPPPLVPRNSSHLSDLANENIIQMTENDVTVNAVTGGLKFRVDPQTLSSNKMYRLPDGRIFAINANPNMPGGYSATIVAVTENSGGKVLPKGATYAAKLSAVSSISQTPPLSKTPTTPRNSSRSSKGNTPKSVKTPKSADTSQMRECDLQVPVEWYRYNLIDAVDALDYSMSRLQKLKKEATTIFLRTRTIQEMRTLHRTLDRLLNTSTSRFREIRENLNKEMKQYITKKMSGDTNVSDDDDVEILNDLDDDPIFIDEASMESNANETNGNDTQEVDLTEAGSSEHNGSGEKSLDQNEGDALACINHINDDSSNTITDNVAHLNEGEKQSVQHSEKTNECDDKLDEHHIKTEEHVDKTEKYEEHADKTEEQDDIKEEPVEKTSRIKQQKNIEENKDDGETNQEHMNGILNDSSKSEEIKPKEVKILGDTDQSELNCDSVKSEDLEMGEDKLQESKDKDSKIKDSEDNLHDVEMSEDMIESLLKDDVENNINDLEIPDELQKA